jgi:hypothetical protein
MKHLNGFLRHCKLNKETSQVQSHHFRDDKSNERQWRRYE